eukprot:TRINITY_DN42296_c0_g1_i1.p1 TRINITY_DN42296_c0_g1~~TRINITY_DN42296_c0_g1_i1.p1  ORF type:complete len:579 (+),score=131.09 TRINITY_DN42296_c0_g1_i1:24-1760(+)
MTHAPRDDEDDVRYLASKRVPEVIDEMLRTMLVADVKPMNPGKWILRFLKNKMDPSGGYVAPRLWVSCHDDHEFDGVYTVTGETVNGMPSWESGDNVIYSTASGWWMLADTPSKIPSNKGSLSSSMAHNNMIFPHQIPCWDKVKDGAWAPTKVTITDTLLTEEPVSPRNDGFRTPSGSPFKDGQWDSPRGVKPVGAGIGDIFMPRANTCKIVHRIFRTDYKSAHVEMQGWRTTMEDAFIQDDNGVLMICDGHGGRDVAEALTAILPIELCKHPWPISEATLKGICHEVDNIILESSDPGGSTACFALVTHNGIPSNTYNVQVANIGDSRAVIYSKRLGRIIFYTIDHKPSEPREKSRLEQAGLYTGERIDGLSVSRSFGDRDEKLLGVIATPEVTSVECEEGDVLLIACDGVFDRLPNEDAVGVVLQELEVSGDPATAAARLCDEALRLGSTDNISCIVTLLTRHALNEDFLPLVECIPGPYTAAWHPAFREGYGRAASEVGTSVAHLLEQRYTDVGIQLANLPHNDASIQGIALRDEFHLFHCDKVSIDLLRTLTGTDRTAWFDAWARSEHVVLPPP